jgi:hypothetical protein
METYTDVHMLQHVQEHEIDMDMNTSETLTLILICMYYKGGQTAILVRCPTDYRNNSGLADWKK